MRVAALLLPMFLLVACEEEAPKQGPVDADADGFVSGEDCDDNDDSAWPGNRETCGDGVDNDCDGAVDESDAWNAVQFFRDADGDGHGVPFPTQSACEVPDGYASTADDCDDADPTVYPGAPELCDGLDNDCDAATPVDEGAATAATWFADQDGDGFGDPSRSVVACVAPERHVADATDCDDSTGVVYPGADELCGPRDEDCDPATGDEEAVDGALWYGDGDGDGYGSPDIPVRACAAPVGHVADATDCDDSREDVNPGAVELCGVGDEDCDPTTPDDEGADAGSWHPDEDGDGYGDDLRTVVACVQPEGHVADGTDCDDARADVNPGAVEVCDFGVDNDCDPATSDLDDPSAREMWLDADGDGYGDPERPAVACGEPLDDHVFDDTDCDDAEPLTNPGLPEICGDGIDNDCVDGPGECGLFGDVTVDDAQLALLLEATTAAAGADINGDGLAELALGVAGESLAGPDGGAVYLFAGPLDGVVGPDAAQAHLVGGPRTELGTAVAPYGDSDGDGVGDWLVGAPGSGEVWVIPGDAGGLGLAAGAALGAFTGDVGAGAALLNDGAAAWVAGAADAVAVAGAGGALADRPDRVVGAGGATLAGADLDGDGVGELVLGLPSDGLVLVAQGPVIGAVDRADLPAWIAEDELSMVGHAVSAGADLDGDGLQDAVVADALGGAWRIDLPDADRSLAEAPLRLEGLGSGGLAVSGDVDADGVGELLATDAELQVILFAGPLADGALGVDAASWRIAEPGIGGWLDAFDLNDDGLSDPVAVDGVGLYAWWGVPGL